MVVFFWYLVKSDFYSVPEKHCHVYLVGLYVQFDLYRSPLNTRRILVYARVYILQGSIKIKAVQ